MPNCLLTFSRLLAPMLLGGLLFAVAGFGAEVTKGNPQIQLMSSNWEERATAVKSIYETPELLRENGIRKQLFYVLEEENARFRNFLESGGGQKSREYIAYYTNVVTLVTRLNDPSSVPVLMDVPLGAGFVEPETIIVLLSRTKPIVDLLITGNAMQKQGAARVISRILSEYQKNVTQSEKNEIKAILLRLVQEKSESGEVKVMAVYALRHFPEEDVLHALEAYRSDPGDSSTATVKKLGRAAVDEVIQELKKKMQSAR